MSQWVGDLNVLFACLDLTEEFWGDCSNEKRQIFRVREGAIKEMNRVSNVGTCNVVRWCD